MKAAVLITNTHTYLLLATTLYVISIEIVLFLLMESPNESSAMVQEVSLRHFEAGSDGICCGQSGNGTGFSPKTPVFPLSVLYHYAPYSHFTYLPLTIQVYNFKNLQCRNAKHLSHISHQETWVN